MSLVRWDPFSSVEESFDRLMPSLFGRWPRMTLDKNAVKYEWRPSADISETDGEYLIRAELPAVKKDDVKVSFDNGVITIDGERKQEKEEKSEKVHRTESFHGTFSRSFSLPDNINADAIRCDSKDGVLTVHIPKVAAQVKPMAKQIRVD
jgi:HSP20 family protein